LDLPLAEIAEASPSPSAKVVPKGWLVRMVSGGRERFVVQQRKRWSAEISSASKALAEPPPLPRP
jgi:hypothetical protein